MSLNLSNESGIVPCGRTDRQAGRHDEAKSLFAILRTRLKVKEFELTIF
jgi:hypothetical protein